MLVKGEVQEGFTETPNWAMLKFWTRLQAPSRLARILGLEDHVEKFQSLRSESFNFNTNYGLIRPGASCFRIYCASWRRNEEKRASENAQSADKG